MLVCMQIIIIFHTLLLPPIRNKCRWLSTNIILSWYKIADGYFRSEGVTIMNLSFVLQSHTAYITNMCFL
jgi:hypothetical protein